MPRKKITKNKSKNTAAEKVAGDVLRRKVAEPIDQAASSRQEISLRSKEKKILEKVRVEAEKQAILAWYAKHGEIRMGDNFIVDENPAPASPYVLDLRENKSEPVLKTEISIDRPLIKPKEIHRVPPEQKLADTLDFANPKSVYFEFEEETVVTEPERSDRSLSVRKSFREFFQKRKLSRSLPVSDIDRISPTQTIEPEIFNDLSDITSASSGIENLISSAPSEYESINEPVRLAAGSTRPKFPVLLRLKTAAVFVCLALLTVLPVKAYRYYEFIDDKKLDVFQAAGQAFAHFALAKDAVFGLDIAAANNEFKQATLSFAEAKRGLKKINLYTGYILKLIPSQHDEVQTAQSLLLLGEDLSKAGEYLTLAMEALQAESGFLTDKIKVFSDNMTLAYPYIKEAAEQIDLIDPAYLPADKIDLWYLVKDDLPVLRGAMGELNLLAKTSLDILGYNSPKRYIILNQDNWELRATGGFIGSLVEIDFDRGQVKRFNIPATGPYDLSGQLLVNIVPPEPLLLLNDRWELQDANWYADFPESARKFLYFYDKAGGPTVDGVIAWNATTMKKILEIVGPIDLPDYGKTITADNFFTEILTAVEFEYDKEENKPKKILADLAPLVIEKILAADSGEWLKMVKLLSEILTTKELQMYFIDEETERVADYFGWSGQTDELGWKSDYLGLTFSNLAGQKTDGVTVNKVDLTVRIAADGTVTNDLVVKRQHNGKAGEPLTGVNNVSYVRVAVPDGAELLSAGGWEKIDKKLFQKPEDYYEHDPEVVETEGRKIIHDSGTEIYRSDERTVFAGWMLVKPGESGEIRLSYRLPFKVEAEASRALTPEWLTDAGDNLRLPTAALNGYELLVDKQSGTANIFSVNVDYPIDWRLVWYAPEDKDFLVNGENLGNRWNYSGVLDRDGVYRMVFGR